MSDMRDSTFVRDDSARFSQNPSLLSEPIRDDVVIVDDGGLSNFHIDNEAEEAGSRRSKLFAGVAVAAVVVITGAFGISQYMKDQPVVADQSLPAPSVPKTAAMTPPPAASEAEATAPSATTPAASDAVKPTPVIKQAATANASKVTPMPRSSSTASPPLTPEQQYTAPATTPVPANVAEPVSPAPPATVQAGNPALNQQSAEPPAEQPQAAQPAAPEAAQPVAPADTPAQ